MSDETRQLILLAAAAVYQMYATNTYPIVAMFWDVIATVTGYLAWYLGRISMFARLSYMEAVKQ